MKKLSLLGYAIPLIIFTVTAVLLYYGLDRDPSYVPSPLINKSIPINKKIFLGKISLLNVWASWCVSCKQEQSMLMEIAKTKQVVIYGLNYKDQRSQALKWLAENGNPYRQVLFDEQGKLGVDLGVYGTPETYLIDEAAIIRYKYIGPLTKEVWDKIIFPQVQKLKNNSTLR